jgi:hypothetical protein
VSPKNQGGRRSRNWSGYGGRAWRKLMDKVKRGTRRREAIEEQHDHPLPRLAYDLGPTPWMHQHVVMHRDGTQTPLRADKRDNKWYPPAPPGRASHDDACWCPPCVRERAEKIIEALDIWE